MPLILTGNTFSNNHGPGAWTSKSTAAMDNTFSANSGGGLHIQGDSTGDISENVFQNNREYGLYARTLEETVTHNTFTGNRGDEGAGFYIEKSLIGNVTHNTFTNNSAKWRGGGFCVELTEPAAVTLQIHAVDGSLVRTLSLGHKTVGTYQNRSRAAYWDGKNELGEAVASGVYFYTLTAGNFTATRKMLIRK